MDSLSHPFRQKGGKGALGKFQGAPANIRRETGKRSGLEAIPKGTAFGAFLVLSRAPPVLRT